MATLRAAEVESRDEERSFHGHTEGGSEGSWSNSEQEDDERGSWPCY